MPRRETRTDIARSAQRIAAPSGNVVRPTQAQLSGMYVGQVKTGGITAGTPSSDTLGTGTVTVYRRSGSTSTASGGDIAVVTLCPIITPAGMWVQVVQDKFGTNWLWRDLSHIKAKAGAAISVGGSGTCDIWEGGSDTGENVTAYYDWIDAADLSSGDELILSYDWAQERWWIVDAECP